MMLDDEMFEGIEDSFWEEQKELLPPSPIKRETIFGDAGLNSLETTLENYIIDSGNEIDSYPFSTCMDIDEDGRLFRLPEFIICAIMKTPQGELQSCRLIPSIDAIFVEGKLVQNLAL